MILKVNVRVQLVALVLITMVVMHVYKNVQNQKHQMMEVNAQRNRDHVPM